MEISDSTLLDASFALSVNLEVLVAASSALLPNRLNIVTPAATAPRTRPRTFEEETKLNRAMASLAVVIDFAKDKNAFALSQATCALDIAIIAITAALYAPYAATTVISTLPTVSQFSTRVETTPNPVLITPSWDLPRSLNICSMASSMLLI